jgi:hypothetical protein
MKSERLKRLQTWMIIVLVVYAMMAVYVCTFIVNQRAKPIWGSNVAYVNEESQNTSVQRLQSNIRSAGSSVGFLSRRLNEESYLLRIFFLSTVGIIGFLGWNLFMIGRLKKEDSIGKTG